MRVIIKIRFINGFTVATQNVLSPFHRKGYIYSTHFSLEMWPPKAFNSQSSVNLLRVPHPPIPIQQSKSPSLAAKRWQWTLSCCSSSWFGCQSFIMILSMLRAYTVCVGMTSLCTWDWKHISTSPIILQYTYFSNTENESKICVNKTLTQKTHKPVRFKPEPN